MTYSRFTGENPVLLCTWGIHISMKIPKTVRQNEVHMSFWTKKGKVGISLVDEKANIW